MYNASSPLFREVVFGNDQAKTVELAVRHTKLVTELMDHYSCLLYTSDAADE